MLADDLFNLVAQADGEVSEAFYTAFGHVLARSEKLMTHGYEFVRIAEAIVAAESEAGAAWLAALLEHDRNVFSALPKGRRDAFRTAILTRWVDEPSSDFEHYLERIRGMNYWRKGIKDKVAAEGS